MIVLSLLFSWFIGLTGIHTWSFKHLWLQEESHIDCSSGYIHHNTALWWEEASSRSLPFTFFLWTETTHLKQSLILNSLQISRWQLELQKELLGTRTKISTLTFPRSYQLGTLKKKISRTCKALECSHLLLSYLLLPTYHAFLFDKSSLVSIGISGYRVVWSRPEPEFSSRFVSREKLIQGFVYWLKRVSEQKKTGSEILGQ